MPAAMRHLQKEMDRLGSPMICYNGGYLIHDGESEKKILDDVSIHLDFCEKIIHLSKNSQIHISLYNGEEWFESKMDHWAEREIRNTKAEPIFRSSEEVFVNWKKENTGAHKVMCMGPVEEIDLLFREAEKSMNDHLHLYRSKDTYIEIAPKSISKASALNLLLKTNYDFGMENIMAFGDNYNDIEMVKQVGFGVAVANAKEEVKAVADEITASHKEDGVAIMIEKYLLKRFDT
jgi:Cof subfamily protein (haloacid dehalogenase superfamily)